MDTRQKRQSTVLLAVAWLLCILGCALILWAGQTSYCIILQDGQPPPLDRQFRIYGVPFLEGIAGVAVIVLSTVLFRRGPNAIRVATILPFVWAVWVTASVGLWLVQRIPPSLWG